METIKFEEIIEINPKISLVKDKIYPFIEMANVAEYQRQPYQIDEKTYKSGVKFEKGDTVIARIEPCLQNGKGFYVNNIDQGFGSTEFIVFRSKDSDRLDEKYLYYLMQQSYIRETMIKSMTGSTGRQRVNNKVFENIELNIPNINKQNQIVKILSSYDDLIENNTKRIKLLEESVELIYKEWFVNLKFPGYEKCNIVDEIPADWNKISVKNILLKHKRKPKVKKEFYLEKGKIPIVDQSRSFIGGYTDNEEAMEDYTPAIVFGDHTRIVKFIDFKFASGADGTQLIYSNTEEISQEYLYFAIKNIDLSNYSYARHFKYLKEEEIYIPDIKIMLEFTNISKNILTQVATLRSINEKLKEARDILIPRLIYGEIEV